jgi:quaternary ammonium compound-resistance protein SugE
MGWRVPTSSPIISKTIQFLVEGKVMAWVILIFAGFAEVAMAFCLKNSHGFSHLIYSIGFLFFAVLSFYLLSVALKDLPIGTAYAVWTGIGALGTALVGIFVLREAADIGKLISLGLIVAGVVGLQILGNGH